MTLMMPEWFASLTVGSNRKARPPFTLNSSGWLSVVPTKFAPGTVPALPADFQKFELLNPPSVVAFTFASPAPLPLKLLPALLSVIALPYVPDKPAPGATFPAVIAYGAGVRFCRGVRMEIGRAHV